MTTDKRYSELDWLRVILVLAVFLHHVFMPFNGDDWHIVNAESSKLLDDVMVYFEQLRLQTLFFIAGAASVLLLPRYGAKGFLLNKFHRLFVPLMVGMMLIVPPQEYFENINQYTSLLAAYQALVFSFQNNHLWFIEFLVVFMLVAVPVNLLLDGQLGRSLIRSIEKLARSNHGLFFLVVGLLILRGFTKWVWPSDGHGIDNLSVSLFYLSFFLAGMAFIKSQVIWHSIGRHRRSNLRWLMLSSIAFYGYYYSPDLSPYLSLEVRWQIWWLLCSLVSWSGLLTMVGYASTYLQKTPSWLHQANELIYPFYILHQTAIVAIAYYVVQWQASIPTKSLTVLVSSFIVCAVICVWIIRPFNPMRYLFGLKIKK